jgi:hypothetical protein
MAKAYHISQWGTKYEKSDTRKTDFMSWYAKQTKLVGLGIGKTLREQYPRNMQLLGLWTMIETLASQSAVSHRGWLVRDGKPLDFDGMSSLLPTVPADGFKMACEWFAHPSVGWLELIEFNPANPTAEPENRRSGGKTAGEVPANPTAEPENRRSGGKNSATDRQRDRERTIQTEREGPAQSEIPSDVEVRAWAERSGVDPDYAAQKLASTTEDNGWVRNGQLIDWRRKWLRWWSTDRAKWLKNKKTATTSTGGRTPAQARFELNKALEEVQERLDAAHENSVAPDAADVAKEKKLRAELAALQASGGS